MAYDLKELDGHEAPTPARMSFTFASALEQYLSLRKQATAILAQCPELSAFLGAIKDGDYASAHDAAMADY